MTSSTVSKESAPRSSTKEACDVTFSGSTPSSLMMISLTRDSVDSAILSSPLGCDARQQRVPTSLHDHPAIDDDDLPGNIAGTGTGQKPHECGNILWLAQ